MKPIITLFLVLTAASRAWAGGKDIVEDRQLLLQYLKQSVFPIDTTAQAVILHESGTSYMANGNLSYRVERTIKILGTDAIPDLATLSLPHNENAVITRINATTYNLENGEITEQSVERSDILKDKLDKHTTVTKFNLPSVKKGSVIHYSYLKEQPGFVFLPGWDFQNEYPTLCSEYEINMPDYISYNAIERVRTPMVNARKERELETCEGCFFDNSFGGTHIRSWVRRNIPAFKKEDYTSSDANYRERIDIHVVAVRNGNITIDIYRNWKDFSKEFLFKDQSYCGQAFNKNSFLAEKTGELTAGKNSELEKTRAIYSYIRNNFSLVPSADNRANNIEEVYQRKSGSQAGINLLLVAMLRKAGINSAPVLLSTRENERLNVYYPNPGPINCLVGLATVDHRRYFMDASQKELPFGILMPDCYNGYCRIINEEGDDATLDPDSLINKSSIVVTLNPIPKEERKFALKMQYQLGILSAIAYRRQWQKDSSSARKEMSHWVENSGMNITLKNLSVKNLDAPDEKLSIECEAVVELSEAQTIYFEPYFVRLFEKNPYPAANRQFSIERDYKEDFNYVLNFQLPEGYQVDDYPKSATLKFGNEELIILRNMMSYDASMRRFSLSSRFSTKTTLFAAEEYNDLRAFHEQVLEEQHKKIVLKKIK
jgi:hypothetical protein